MYADWGSEGEDDEEPTPDDVDVHASLAWDTRGKTGLYGGGGRGANDRETGWVQDYEIQRHTSRREEKRTPASEHAKFVPAGLTRTSRSPRALYRAPQPRHPQRHPSSGSDYSSPPSSSSSSGTDNLVDSFLPLRRDRPRQDDYLRTPVAQPAALHVSLTPPPAPRAVAAPKAVRFHPAQTVDKPASPFLSVVAEPAKGLQALKKRISLAPPFQRPFISDPFPVNTPFPIPVGARPPDLARELSLLALKWTTKTKKAPVISEPILPAGFVHSLGMSTFSIPRPISTSAVPSKPRDQAAVTAPRDPHTFLPAAFPLLPAHEIKATPAALVLIGLTPLGALRQERDTERDFHRDLAEAFRRISTDSILSDESNDSQSTYALSFGSVGETRQQLLEALHSDRLKDVVAVQASQGPAVASFRAAAPLQPRSTNVSQLKSPSPPILAADAFDPPSSSSVDATDLHAFADTKPLRGATSSPPRRIFHTPPPLVLGRRPSHDYRKSMSPEGAWIGAGKPDETAPAMGTPVFRNPFASASPSANLWPTSPPVSGGWQPGW